MRTIALAFVLAFVISVAYCEEAAIETVSAGAAASASASVSCTSSSTSNHESMAQSECSETEDTSFGDPPHNVSLVEEGASGYGGDPITKFVGAMITFVFLAGAIGLVEAIRQKVPDSSS